MIVIVPDYFLLTVAAAVMLFGWIVAAVAWSAACDGSAPRWPFAVVVIIAVGVSLGASIAAAQVVADWRRRPSPRFPPAAAPADPVMEPVEEPVRTTIASRLGVGRTGDCDADARVG